MFFLRGCCYYAAVCCLLDVFELWIGAKLREARESDKKWRSDFNSIVDEGENRMKKSMFVLGLFAAGLMVASGPGLSRAGDLEVTGFADIQYFIDNEHPALDPAGGRNVVERQFVVKGEIDFEKETDNLTFRMDLDFP
ncbi:MAG: hypothetical protein ACE5F7_11120, partial [Nitrospiria bacterium]